MSSTAEKLSFLTVEQYLTAEETSSVKHEYINGCIFAMTGATSRHNRITGNIFTKLHAFVDGVPCQAYIEAFKVYIKEANCFYYPDIMVACESIDEESVFTERPVLIVEVLSPSTAAIDRREKLINYLRLPTLREYVMVHQARKKVELFRRDKVDTWSKEQYHAGDHIVLKSFPNGELTLSVDSIYRNISQTGGTLEVREGKDDYDDDVYAVPAAEAALLDW
ncbi:MAG TPA: Uma2 family endonuclease [Candidatus Obscuribacterales bacterium]